MKRTIRQGWMIKYITLSPATLPNSWVVLMMVIWLISIKSNWSFIWGSFWVERSLMEPWCTSEHTSQTQRRLVISPRWSLYFGKWFHKLATIRSFHLMLCTLFRGFLPAGGSTCNPTSSTIYGGARTRRELANPIRLTPNTLFFWAFLDMEPRITSLLPFKTMDFSSLYNKLNLRENKKRKMGGAWTLREEPVINEENWHTTWRRTKGGGTTHRRNNGTFGLLWMISQLGWIVWPWGWRIWDIEDIRWDQHAFMRNQEVLIQDMSTIWLPPWWLHVPQPTCISLFFMTFLRAQERMVSVAPWIRFI